MVKTITRAMAQQHMLDLLKARLEESGYTPLSFQMWQQEEDGEKLWRGHAKAARKAGGGLVMIQSLEWLDDAWVSLDVISLNAKAMAALRQLTK